MGLTAAPFKSTKRLNQYMQTHTPPLGLTQNIKRMNGALRIWPALASAALLFTAGANATDLVWVGGTQNWNSAVNWSPAQIPGAADNAFITNNGTYTVTVPQNTPTTVASLTIGGASGTQTLAIDKTTLTLNGPSRINVNGHLDFLAAGSTLTGAGNLTVEGTVNWANGTMSGTGTTTIGSGGELAIGSGGVTFGRTLNNGGVGTWAGGNLSMSAGVTFNNLASGTFDITADGRLSGGATTPINNAGLFRQTAGTVSTVVTVPFNNSGTLQVQAASLNLGLGGNHTGTMAIAAGATLNFAGGSHVLATGSLVTGAGVLTLSGGATTLAASGTFDAGSTLSITAGAGTLSAGCNVTGATLNIGGGVLNYNSAGSVATVNLTAGTLGGTSPVTVTGPLTLSGGTVTNALVTANGGLTISGNATLNGGKLVNPGLATWTAGNFTGANGAVISNLFGATFNNTFDGNAASGAGATPIFVNAGSFRKTGATAAAGTTSIDFQFINSGTVEVQTNTLRYGINQQTAGLTLLDGGGLTAQAQPIQLLGGSLVGTGLVTVANTLNFINSSTVSPGLTLGELDISGNYQQTGSGVLNIELGGYSPGSGFDLVTVTGGGAGGVATLGGTLNVTLTNGFSPTNGATFTFLTAVSRAGVFGTFNYPSNDIGMLVTYDATSAKVTVSNLKPVVANPIANPAPVTYGAAFDFQFPANTFTDPDGDTLTYSSSGMPAGITFTGSTRTFSGTPAQAGIFSVAVAATDNGTPSLSVTNTFTITVNPAPLTITANNQSKAYGAALPTLTVSYSGFVNGDTAASLTTPPTVTTSATTGSAAGTYPITASGAVDANYTLSYSPGTLTVTPVGLTITANNQSKAYGAPLPALTVSYTGFVNGDTAASLTTPPTVTTTATAGSAVGAYPITAGGAVDGNYTISYLPGTLTVNPVGLTITANNQSKAYGAVLPALTVGYSGFVNGDTAASLTTRPTVTTTATASSAVGTYPITASGAVDANYTISYASGTLTVTPAGLTITANNQSKAYAATVPTLTLSYSGFVNGDTAASLTTPPTVTTTATASSAVGTYPITVSGAVDANYTISYSAGTLTVTPVSLTITADNQSKAYGAAVSALTASYSGFVNGDTAASLTTPPTVTTTATASSAVGTYPITASGAVDANYTISYSPGTLTVTPAGLTITANNQSKAYGAVLPALTASYSGFVNGDTAASLTTPPTVTTTATANSAVGTYPITASGAVDANYTITYSPGTLTITSAGLTITANNQSKAYAAVLQALTVSYSGFVNGDTAASLTTPPTVTTTSAASSAVGTYPITASGAVDANYTISYSPGTLTVTPVGLTITANNQSKAYGAVLPALTVSYSGFVNGDTAASLTIPPTVTTTAAASSAVGTYLITASGAVDPNYTITYSPGTLTVTPVGLTITANNQSKAYAAVLPALTVSYSGFVNGDTAASLTTPPTVTTTATASSAVGTYPITASGAADANYTISYSSGTLTVTPVGLTITANNQSKAYGAVLPTLTASYSGFVNGDTAASLTTPPTVTTTATASSAVGTYPITASGAVDANYMISYSPGTLTVTPVGLTITANNQSKLYGAAVPALTVSYSGFVNGDSATSLTTPPTVATTALASSAVGTYPITANGAVDSNYAISYLPGTLTVTRAALSVTADSKSKAFDAADPAFTATYAGFVNGETQAVLDGTLSFTRAPGENAGTYLITPSGLTSANYAINFNTGTLTITASAPLILALTSAATTNVVITWNAVSNTTYRVQYKGVLSATNWTDLIGDVLAGGSTASKTDLKTTTNRFYRVQVLP
jgi:uncharacterized protein involved in high-affinity Fe2+ transport